MTADFGGARWESWEMPIGIRFFTFGDMPFLPLLDVSYVRSIGESGPSQQGSFADTGWTSESTEVPRQGRDALRVTATVVTGVPTGRDSGLVLDLNYRFELRDAYIDNGMYIGLAQYF